MRVHVAQLYVRQYRFDEAMAHLQHAQSTDYYNLEVARLLREVAPAPGAISASESCRLSSKRIPKMDRLISKSPISMSFAGEIKKAITHFQKASREPELKNISNAKLANAMARLRMFDLSEETLDEVTLNVNSSEERNQLKALFFRGGRDVRKRG